MSIDHSKVILDQGLPVKVPRTAQIVQTVILWRYDNLKTLKETREPNPGYGKSYPGMEELMRANESRPKAAPGMIRMTEFEHSSHHLSLVSQNPHRAVAVNLHGSSIYASLH